MASSQGIRGFFKRKSVLAVNLGVVLFIAWGFAGEYVRNRDMDSEIERLRAEAGQLESRNLELAKLAKRLSEPEMLEREARLKLNLQKPGEEVVVVRDLSPARQQAEAAAAEVAASENGSATAGSNPGKWLRHFFK